MSVVDKLAQRVAELIIGASDMYLRRQVAAGNLICVRNLLACGKKKIKKVRTVQHQLVVCILADNHIVIEIRQITLRHLLKAKGHAFQRIFQITSDKT